MVPPHPFRSAEAGVPEALTAMEPPVVLRPPVRPMAAPAAEAAVEGPHRLPVQLIMETQAVTILPVWVVARAAWLEHPMEAMVLVAAAVAADMGTVPPLAGQEASEGRVLSGALILVQAEVAAPPAGTALGSREVTADCMAEALELPQAQAG